jgi:hypothetical protein
MTPETGNIIIILTIIDAAVIIIVLSIRNTKAC